MAKQGKKNERLSWFIIGAVFALPLVGAGLAQLRNAGSVDAADQTKTALAHCLTDQGVRVYGA